MNVLQNHFVSINNTSFIIWGMADKLHVCPVCLASWGSHNQFTKTINKKELLNCSLHSSCSPPLLPNWGILYLRTKPLKSYFFCFCLIHSDYPFISRPWSWIHASSSYFGTADTARGTLQWLNVICANTSWSCTEATVGLGGIMFVYTLQMRRGHPWCLQHSRELIPCLWVLLLCFQREILLLGLFMLLCSLHKVSEALLGPCSHFLLW